MDFRQSNFEEIIESEKEMILTAEKRYGAYYVNAFEFNILLGDFINSIDTDRYKKSLEKTSSV